MTAIHPPTTLVGIGASAGGITAVRTLLPTLPARQDVAYVLAQHLSPSHRSKLDEILGRLRSDLSVRMLTEDTTLEGDCLFIVPPDAQCRVRGQTLHLEPAAHGAAPRHGIDALLTSMADAFGERAVAIILTGTGEDGLRGVRAIRAAGGTALVQDPAEAEYSGMPQAVVRHRLADAIAPLARLGDTLVRLLDAPGAAAPATEADEFSALVKLLVRRSGWVFDQFQDAVLRRLVERRMRITGRTTRDGYSELIENSDSEVEQLRDDLLVPITSFFRDTETLDGLRHALQSTIHQKASGQPIRVWVPGCASGEEAYAIAMLLADLLDDDLETRPVRIFATDVDVRSVAATRQGSYSDAQLHGVPPELVSRYFHSEKGTNRVNGNLRDVVTAAPHDLLQDPPFAHLDLISSRNLLIFLKPEAQKQVIGAFHYALEPGGHLVLGPTENAAPAAEVFEPVEAGARVFLRGDTATPVPGPPVGPRTGLRGPASLPDTQRVLERRVRDALFRHYAPPAVLVDDHLNALFVHGDVSSYAKLRSGSVTGSLLDMLDAPLRLEMQLVVQRSLRENASVRASPVTCTDDQGTHTVVLVALPVVGVSRYAAAQTLVIFERRTATDTSAPAPSGSAKDTPRLRALERELVASREHLQTHIGELEAVNEELRSLNEEYLSTAAELQTTNQELKSSNEALQRVSEALRSANRDLEDILNVAVAGVVVLDEDLHVTRYSAGCSEIFSLMPSSIGKPLVAVGGPVDLSLLSAPIRQAMTDRAPAERHLELGDRVYLLQCVPRQGPDGGLIISFVDVTEDAEAARRAQRLSAVLRDSSDAIAVYAPDGRITAWNPGAERLYGYSEREALRMSVYDLVPEPLKMQMRDLIRKVMTHKRAGPIETKRRSRDGRIFDVAISATALANEQGQSYAIASTVRDITPELEVRAQRRQAELAHHERLTTAGEMATGIAHELNQPLTAIMHFSDLARSILGRSRMARRGEVMEALTGITQQADRAGSIIRSLRHFVGRQEGRRESCTINDVVNDTVSFMRWDLENLAVTTELHLADDVPSMTCDRSQIEQVIVNIMRNSAEAMDEAQSPHRHITISTRNLQDQAQGGVEVTIQDTGPGVPAKTANLLFAPFQTTKTNGLGMGLWIARSIVEAHGGRLWPELQEGPGATFHFTLRQRNGGGHDLTMNVTDTATIFVVDDDPAVRSSLTKALTARGYRVEAYGSATSFLQGGLPDRPGCLVLDVLMPEVSGLELQDMLQQHGVHLPIIFVTGHGDIPMTVRALKHGAVDFLEKPYSIDVLLARIEEALATDTAARRTEQHAQRVRRRLERLTEREREVFDQLTSENNVSNKDVARTLGISHRTVEVHRARIMRKLGAGSLADLVQMAAVAQS